VARPMAAIGTSRRVPDGRYRITVTPSTPCWRKRLTHLYKSGPSPEAICDGPCVAVHVRCSG
jgi:hypothetical protein